MNRAADLEALLIGAHALTRIAAVEIDTETPAAQWRTLAILRENGPQRLGDLARLSRVTQPGMTRLVGTMAEAGLVERTPDPDDARATRIAVTEQGVEAFAAWRAHLVEALLPRFASLDDDDWAALRRTAELLRAQTAATTASSPSSITNGGAR